MIRLRTLLTLFAASSVVTIGLRAAGAFDGDSVRRAVRDEIIEHVDTRENGRRREMAMTLVRATPVTDEFAWSGLATGADELEIRTLLGTIEAVGAAGDSIRVFAMREGDGRGDVQVKAIDRGDRITVCASHPSSGSR